MTDTTPVTPLRRQLLPKVFIAEFIGTMVLVMVGPGSAIIDIPRIGTIGVSLAFGFALLAMAYTIGHVSGCHINPAVTLAFLLHKKILPITAAYYWLAQVLGGVVGAFVIWVITDTGRLDTTGNFAANGWGSKILSQYGVGSAIAVEVVFTALLIFVVLSTGTEGYLTGFDGIAVGFTLAMIHLTTIPVDNTSVNPARSIATALFSGWDAMSQLWVFLIFPLVGAVVGYGAYYALHLRKDHISTP